MKAAFAMTPGLQHRFFDDGLLQELRDLVDIETETVLETFDTPTATDVELLVTSWGCPPIDDAALTALPRLRAVVHAAGSVKAIAGAGVWERDLRITSGAALNARPVAEFAFAAVVWAGKSVLPLAERFSRQRRATDLTTDPTITGNYRTTVGVLGASATGRALLAMLDLLDVHVLVADPTIDADAAEALGAELVSLDDLFSRSDVVSVHAPLLPATHHLVDRRLLALMPDGATLINTARGPVVDHDPLRAELTAGRLKAILDVTDPEPLPADDPLWDLPNVTLTPHVAGSQGRELLRLGRAAVEEVRAFVEGRPPVRPVSAAALETSA
ncbi:hydroxyacid dehydrogenase [Mumia sp. DW29H23]|uniref:hydroxyacid dehydrogenase n=1 Tax=Mumia sp. DW29H23 TaxID=3421241 RepID=UPI003D689CDF